MLAITPEQASEVASETGLLNDWIMGISVLFTVAIVGVWFWKFDYEGKKKTVNELAVPVNTPANQMPSFEGQFEQDEILSIIPLSKTVEVDEEEVRPTAAMTPLEKGKLIYEARLCKTCHSLDGSPAVGPTFKGLYGRSGKLVDGSEYTADDAYIFRSIKEPSAEVVEGFAPAMPIPGLSDEDIQAVIEFLKAVK